MQPEPARALAPPRPSPASERLSVDPVSAATATQTTTATQLTNDPWAPTRQPPHVVRACRHRPAAPYRVRVCVQRSTGALGRSLGLHLQGLVGSLHMPVIRESLVFTPCRILQSGPLQ